MEVEVFSEADAVGNLDSLRVEDFHQSPERMRWLRRQGYEARLVVVRAGGEPLALALLERAAGRWHLWKGPAGAASAEVLGAFLEACRDLRDVTLVLQPEWALEPVLRAAGFAPVAPFTTLLVPTGGGDEAILARMRPATRSRVRRSLRAGLSFVDDAGYAAPFHAVYAEAMRVSGSPDFATLDELRSLLELPQAHLFLALREGAVAAGSVCFEHEHAVEARYVATSPEHRRLGPMNLVHFETIRWARARGRDWLDLSGWATSAADEKAGAINRFKEGFGGRRHEYPTYSRAEGGRRPTGR